MRSISRSRSNSATALTTFMVSLPVEPVRSTPPIGRAVPAVAGCDAALWREPVGATAVRIAPGHQLIQHQSRARPPPGPAEAPIGARPPSLASSKVPAFTIARWRKTGVIEPSYWPDPGKALRCLTGNAVRENPEWNFLFLTKFPQRMAEFDIPRTRGWAPTSRPAGPGQDAEGAFADVKSGIRWLSVEPMLERLSFNNLDRFNWVVIGGASASSQSPAWHPPFEWIADLVRQVRAAGAAIYMKTNLGIENRIVELPFNAPTQLGPTFAPDVFHYLGKTK